MTYRRRRNGPLEQCGGAVNRALVRERQDEIDDLLMRHLKAELEAQADDGIASYVNLDAIQTATIDGMFDLEALVHRLTDNLLMEKAVL